MLKRFLLLLVAAAVLIPSLTIAGTSAFPWVPGTKALMLRRTLASTATTPYSGPNSGSLYNVAGTVVGSFRDSAFIFRANTAGQMQFDTLSAFSLADLPGWCPVPASIVAAAAGDSLWAFSLEFLPVNDGFTTALAAGTTGGGATITADSLNYYMEVSLDGGINWNRTISLLAHILETGTTNSFHLAFNSQPMWAESGTLGPANFLSYNALYRFVLVHDCAGKYQAVLTYPKLASSGVGY